MFDLCAAAPPPPTSSLSSRRIEWSAAWEQRESGGGGGDGFIAACKSPAFVWPQGKNKSYAGKQKQHWEQKSKLLGNSCKGSGMFTVCRSAEINYPKFDFSFTAIELYLSNNHAICCMPAADGVGGLLCLWIKFPICSIIYSLQLLNSCTVEVGGELLSVRSCWRTAACSCPFPTQIFTATLRIEMWTLPASLKTNRDVLRAVQEQYSWSVRILK